MPVIKNRQIISSSVTSATEGTPTSSEIEFPEPKPPIQECDRLLGLYMRSWNLLEDAIFNLFQKLLGAHPTAARIILASGLSNQTLREIVSALAGQRLTTVEFGVLENLLDRVKKATTKRNKIVHGVWQIAINLTKGRPNSATWERFYPPTDPSLYPLIIGPKMNQKVRDAHVFSIRRISTISEETYNLSQELRQFTIQTAVSEFQNPQPITPSQPAA